MKRCLATFAIAVAAMTALSGSARAAETWTVDSVHSTVMLEITHNGVAPFFARFNEKSGSITVDTANPANSSVEVTVNPASFDSGNTKRDDHVRSPDFLSVKEFPSMSFKSSKVSSSGKGKYRVTGMLEIRGQKKEVSFDVTETRRSTAKGELAGYYTEFRIKRSEWGISGFTDGLSDDITVYISLECKKS